MTEQSSREPTHDSIQRAVLGCLLELHPARLSQAELLRELNPKQTTSTGPTRSTTPYATSSPQGSFAATATA